MDAKKLFSKFNLRNWIPYWKVKDDEDIGESIIEEMERRNISSNEFREFYVKHGDTEIEFMEKLIMERIKQGDLDKMSKIECAFLGLSEFHEFMKQIVVEINAREDMAKLENQIEKEKEEEKK